MHLQRLIPLLALANSIGHGLAENCGCTPGMDGAAVLRICNTDCDSVFTQVPQQVDCQNGCSTWLGAHGCSVPHRRSEEYDDDLSIDERELDLLSTRSDDSAGGLTTCLSNCASFFKKPGAWCRGTKTSVALNGG